MESMQLRHLTALKPTPPEVYEVATSAAAPADALPVTTLRNDDLIEDWLVVGPMDGTVDDVLASDALNRIFGAVASGTDVRIADQGVPTARVDADTINPAGHGRIGLDTFFQRGRATHAIVLVGALDVACDQLARVLTGRLRAVMRIGEVLVRDGDFVRLHAGRHAIALIADSRVDYGWDPICVAPRVVPCTDEQLALFQREREQSWQSALQCAAAEDPAASVRITPDSIRGTDGYVRVGRTPEGYWWFLDANGRPFFYKGVCSVNRAGRQGGRRAVDGAYAATVDAKYGYQADGPDAFVEACLTKLRTWGFNGLGSWTTEEFFERGMHYTDNVEFYCGFPSTQTAHCIDIFDPQWHEFVDRKAREICAPQKNNRWLVGYFTDNERSFASVGTVALDLVGRPILEGISRSLLQLCLSEDPATPLFEAAWSFVLERHDGSLEAVASGWGSTLASKADVRRHTDAGETWVSDGFRVDADAFVAFYCGTFCRITAEAIRRHDPNHLVLGWRWAGPHPLAVMEAEAPWVDVISINNYQDMFYERLNQHPNPFDHPILIGEFCWNDDSHMTIEMPFEDPVGLTSTDRMIVSGSKALRRVFRHPNVAGWTWYRWISDSPMHSPRSCGLVFEDDELHPWNVPGLSLLQPHAEHDRVAAAAAATTPVNPFEGRLAIVLQAGALQRRSGQHHPVKVVFGATVRMGVDTAVSGYGVAGTVHDVCFADGQLSLIVDLTFSDVLFAPPVGSAAYRIVLTGEHAGHLTGHYEGHHSGEPFAGDVSAWRE